jgi:chemotaxis methyl-accepting protein methylase
VNTYTYFFREPETIEAVRDHLLAKQQRKKRLYMIWSAGCSTGEEA